MHMHAGATRQLLYGCSYVREIIHSLKLVDYPPDNNLHLFMICFSSLKRKEYVINNSMIAVN